MESPQLNPQIELDETQKALKKVLANGMSVLGRPPVMKMSEWADEHFYLSSESSYVEGKWETINYQRSIMDVMGLDDVEVINFIKSARVGYTKMLMAGVGYFSEHKKRNQLILLPSDEPAKQFMRQHVEPMIRDVPVMKRLASWFGKKDKNSTERVKILDNGKVIHSRGGAAGKNYRELSVDVVIYDELEGFPIDVEEEGSPLTLGDKRTEGSLFRKSIRGSTPKIKIKSLIQAASDDSEYQFRFHIPCPHCDEEQPLEFGGKHTKHGLKWVNDDPSTVRYACAHCGALSTYQEMQKAQNNGRWKTDDGVWIDPDTRFRNASDEVIDTPKSVAFHIWTAYSPFTTWSTIIREWLSAQGDVTKLKTFVNTTLGEAWDEQGERLNQDDLIARVEDYDISPLPEGVFLVVAGMDTQKDRVEAQLLGIGAGDEIWVLDYKVFPGDPNTVGPWPMVDAWLNRVYTRADGVQLRVARAGIDTGGSATQAVYEYVKPRLAAGVIGLKGMDGDGRPIVGRPTTSNLAKINLFPVGVYAAKDLLFSRLNLQEYGPGYIHFREAVCDEKYFSQLTAEELKFKLVNGVNRKLYMKLPGRTNEALDTFVYALAAYASLGVSVDELIQQAAAQPTPMKQRGVRGTLAETPPVPARAEPERVFL